MIISWKDEYNKCFTAIYWSNGMNLETIEEYGRNCDYIQVWYPRNLKDEIYEKYRELITYIEIEPSWKGETHSAWTNILQSEDDILQKFSKTRRYEAKRAAQKDNLSVEFLCNPSESEIAEFQAYYNRFAIQTQLNELNIKKVYGLCNSGQFVLARVRDAEGEVLAVHGYIIDPKTQMVALFSSSSFFRDNKEKKALICRANVFLHYESMIYFKHNGFKIYDWGGIYLGKNYPRHQSVSDFKRSFGGEIVAFQTGFTIPMQEARNIEHNLYRESKRIKDLDIVLWGYSSFGKYAERKLEENFSQYCQYIIDNKLYTRENTRCVSEQILNELNPERVCILVCTSVTNYNRIVCQDNVMKFVKNNNLIYLRGE